jgi:hypothetical protein
VRFSGASLTINEDAAVISFKRVRNQLLSDSKEDILLLRSGRKDAVKGKGVPV